MPDLRANSNTIDPYIASIHKLGNYLWKSKQEDHPVFKRYQEMKSEFGMKKTVYPDCCETPKKWKKKVKKWVSEVLTDQIREVLTFPGRPQLSEKLIHRFCEEKSVQIGIAKRTYLDHYSNPKVRVDAKVSNYLVDHLIDFLEIVFRMGKDSTLPEPSNPSSNPFITDEELSGLDSVLTPIAMNGLIHVRVITKAGTISKKLPKVLTQNPYNSLEDTIRRLVESNKGSAHIILTNNQELKTTATTILKTRLLNYLIDKGFIKQLDDTRYQLSQDCFLLENLLYREFKELKALLPKLNELFSRHNPPNANSVLIYQKINDLKEKRLAFGMKINQKMMEKRKKIEKVNYHFFSREARIVVENQVDVLAAMRLLERSWKRYIKSELSDCFFCPKLPSSKTLAELLKTKSFEVREQVTTRCLSFHSGDVSFSEELSKSGGLTHKVSTISRYVVIKKELSHLTYSSGELARMILSAIQGDKLEDLERMDRGYIITLAVLLLGIEGIRNPASWIMTVNELYALSTDTELDNGEKFCNKMMSLPMSPVGSTDDARALHQGLTKEFGWRPEKKTGDSQRMLKREMDQLLSFLSIKDRTIESKKSLFRKLVKTGLSFWLGEMYIAKLVRD